MNALSMSDKIGPQTEAADMIQAMKHRERGEDFREAINRVAFGLKDSDEHYKALREPLLYMRFMTGGRIMNSIGASRLTTPYNCYVSGTIEDSFVEGLGCIMDRAKEAAATMRMGGGIGYDFSTLRPRGAPIKGLHSHSSGPISFMDIFNAVCLATASSGHRRGAQMGVMRVDHPDIEEFVRAKQNSINLNGFNISVAVTDEFMEAVAGDKPFDLRFNGEKFRTIEAGALWEKIMRSTWDWAEPGVLFIDAINRMNNLWYCEKIAATNPCGEQPLPPFGACLLGSYNLVKYLDYDPVTMTYSFDYDLLDHDIPIIVRAMDNVIDRARYPLSEQRTEAKTKRRMGLGVMGLANAAEAQGFVYGSQSFLDFETKVLKTIRDGCYKASVNLAKEKGQFDQFDAPRYLKGLFIKTLPDDILHGIEHHGIRNSHLTSIAPTGSISLSADNVSGGIEPVFAYKIDRPINTPDGPKLFQVEDYGSMFLNTKGKLARDVSVDEHINVLLTAQRFIDSAVSKTVNMTGKMPWEDFKNLYKMAHDGGAKGCATFNSDGKRMTLLSESSEEAVACSIDIETGQRDCS